MKVLAAGSLRTVWTSLMAPFPEPVEAEFGPAGLLRERIEAGEFCDLFASANLAHPRALLAAGRALAVFPFASNQLCLTVRREVWRKGDDWFSLLTRETLRIATSTPGADPSGDYAQELFTRMGAAGESVRRRAQALVGGRDSAPIPPGRLAAEWILHSGKAEVFIGYASYGETLRQMEGLKVITIPPPYNPLANYACAVITPQAQPLADFLLSVEAQKIVQQAGFLPSPCGRGALFSPSPRGRGPG